MNLQNFFVLAVQAFCFSLLVTPAHADITVRDDTGQVLHLTQAPKRIVSLAPKGHVLYCNIPPQEPPTSPSPHPPTQDDYPTL